jgi:hypothetical protein
MVLLFYSYEIRDIVLARSPYARSTRGVRHGATFLLASSTTMFYRLGSHEKQHKRDNQGTVVDKEEHDEYREVAERVGLPGDPVGVR